MAAPGVLLEPLSRSGREHFTSSKVIKLMTLLVFIPIKDPLHNPLTIYDPACSSSGMLTDSKDEIKAKAGVYLYGKEINPETYGICKSDMRIKGNDPENILFGSCSMLLRYLSCRDLDRDFSVGIDHSA
ncbi:N-6 DNA methylase [Methylobacter tundripaludum]|uniref:N-6 DNA methylase n=1 Tax=Methylobacter tundripaludum TaxID=173365 RepID=UPI00345F0CE7